MANPEPPKLFDFGAGAFTPAELGRLENLCDGLPLMRSSLSGGAGDYYNDTIRVTDVAQIAPAPDNAWFFERLAAIVRALNNRSFRFDLTGFSEPPQYMVYRDTARGHFDWHMDTGSLPPRKLSLTLQLSEPSSYEGGDFQFNTGTVLLPAPKERGMTIVFPSHMIHRVTPVTKGVRKAIVAWITGPEFK